MFGHRMIIPEKLRRNILNILHEGHPGRSAMMSNAKMYVWWPGITKDVENFVDCCQACQKFRAKAPETPLYCWNVPEKPWDRLHIDFTGPFDGKYWFVLVDAYSKWMEIFHTDSPNSYNVCLMLDSCFARFGVPHMIVSDNGTCFTSGIFKEFCSKRQIKHICTTPYHSRSNGAVERVIRTFKARYNAERESKRNRNECLNRVLFNLRNTPHTSTQHSPAELMLGRKTNSSLNNMRPNIRESMLHAQFKQKQYHDRSSQHREFKPNEKVWVFKKDKHQYIPGEVIARSGPLSYSVDTDGYTERKHADDLRKRECEETQSIKGKIGQVPPLSLCDDDGQNKSEPNQT
ncbi:Pro-Pol polyprotein [Thelohanellus kitauei]|uniref:Pro-Pol polyprotein n=1 Tax=Thelohanellus kitauei TaxID=669202 RepID=A0A0C2JE66_THEKT|nr:Pro-Pol polyprotein [Thelohanellus kitauei]